MDTSNNQSSSSSYVHLYNPNILNKIANDIIATSNPRSKNRSSKVKRFPSNRTLSFTQASHNPTKYPNANVHHPLSFITNPKNHLNNMGTSTTSNNKHDTMNIIMHPHRSSNSGYDIMQHHHHVSIREENDKKFPSTRRKPYHNIMEIGENDDLILRLPFYFYFFFSLSFSLRRFFFS